MYSESFMTYLLKYQQDDFKPAKNEEKVVKHFSFDLNANNYVAIPINNEAK